MKRPILILLLITLLTTYTLPLVSAAPPSPSASPTPAASMSPNPSPSAHPTPSSKPTQTPSPTPTPEPAPDLMQSGLTPELQAAFETLFTACAIAKNKKDDRAVIRTCEDMVSFLREMNQTEQIKDLIAHYLEQAAWSYEHIGDYISAGKKYIDYLPLSTHFGWTDGSKIARAKIAQYMPSMEVYTDTYDTQCYYGAKHEPQKGTLYGEVVDEYLPGDTFQDSMLLYYLEYGDTDTTWLKEALELARRDHLAVEFAWNFPKQGAQCSEVPKDTTYINNIIRVLNQYTDVKIFLRIGAEMNIWDEQTSPEEFKAAFIHIAKLVKNQTKHVALVWSVNQVSSWDVEMNDYYPGDEYVDWVGVSAYAQKYFLGRKDWKPEEKFNEVVFLTGNSADPVKALTEVIQKYGHKKPIMLAECGVSHKIRPLKEDATAWASTQLRRMYAYVPMVYPQVKLIAYFNHEMEGETNDYCLWRNPTIAAAYNKATQASHFIHGNADSEPESVYQKFWDGIYVEQSYLPVYTYAHIWGDDEPTVQYYIDSTLTGTSKELPYRMELDIHGLSLGEHTLRTVVTGKNGIKTEKTYCFTVIPPLSLVVDGAAVTGDVGPVLEDGTTLVPVRAVSEILGADVQWDGEAQMVTIQKGGDTVTMKIGSRTAEKNGKQVKIDLPPRLVKGRTIVPLRTIAEMLGAEVDWNEENRVISIAQL
jgi:hypothetical protein